MRFGAVVVLALVAGCNQPIGSETPCDPGPYFSGPSLENPHAASAGDRVLVQWRMFQEPNIGSHHGVMLGSDGIVIPNSRFDFDPAQEVYDLTSGPDRVLVQGGLASQVGTFTEIRLPTGERQGAPIADVFGLAVFDGDAFLVGKTTGTARRLGLDGTVFPPFAIPPDLSNLAPMATMTWAVFKKDDVLTASRIMRGGQLFDVAPRLVSDDYYYYQMAARPTEAAIVTQDRDGARTWITLSENGTISAPVPLVLDLPYFRPRLLVAERDGYLLVLDNLGNSDVVGVHVSPTGTPGEPFELLGSAGNSLAFARLADRTVIVYGPVHAMRGGPPRIEVIPIDVGATPGAPLLVETVEGESYTVDCGCSAGGGSPGLLVVLVLVLGRRRRRRSPG